MNAAAAVVREALDALGVDRLLLAIHDGCFPASPHEDIGRAAPSGEAGRGRLDYVRGLGFDGLQLGPPGLGPDDDPSPYVTTWFARNPLSISLARLAAREADGGDELLDPRQLARAVAARPPETAADRVAFEHAVRAHRALLGAAFERHTAGLARDEPRAVRLEEQLAAWCDGSTGWLERDELYEVLRAEHAGREASEWRGPTAELDRELLADGPEAPSGRSRERMGSILARHAAVTRFHRFTQFLAHRDHALFRAHAARLGLALYADLPIGPAPRDAWSRSELFLDDHRLGAPPSRTNPLGQPWGYGVFDPDRTPAVRELLARRTRKILAEHDGLRIDHPHGLVCPWVYRCDTSDAAAAVRGGARLRSSPDLPDHPGLARYAIPDRSQLTDDPTVARYAERWVVDLRPEQIERYAELLDVLVEVAAERPAPASPLVVEVLSTMPFELRRVMERHGLGRFRVTHKVDVDDPDDVYQSENAAPADWIMIGTHDTPPLWALLERWEREGALGARAAHLARILEPRPERRESFARRLLTEPGALAQAHLAELFTSPARNVMVFFADLFGLRDVYNTPGTVGPHNWRLRLTHDWRARYETKVRGGEALDLPAALAMAVAARGPEHQPSLVSRLLEAARGAR